MKIARLFYFLQFKETEECKSSVSIHSNQKIYIHHTGLPILHKQKQAQSKKNNTPNEKASQNSNLMKAYLNRTELLLIS